MARKDLPAQPIRVSLPSRTDCPTATPQEFPICRTATHNHAHRLLMLEMRAIKLALVCSSQKEGERTGEINGQIEVINWPKKKAAAATDVIRKQGSENRGSGYLNRQNPNKGFWGRLNRRK
ncbi:hypothetical protein NMG60_11017410 [Bertholletia excelsa]